MVKSSSAQKNELGSGAKVADGKSANHSRDGSTRGGIAHLPLDQLHFDPTNPRFGGSFEETNEAAILDEIVAKYGIDDVLSSIAANGYLETEPMVGVKTQQGVRILEGNRRLAACLILSGDPRATNQQRRAKLYRPKLRQKLDQVPVMVYDEKTQPPQLIPYMGIRHIVGAKEWDSYAKAAWIDRVLSDRKSGITLESIEEMIGDSSGTVRRILEGFYLVQQLQDSKLFRPTDSQRKGRGSNPEYPFSWIYNALGYTAIREWIDMPQDRMPRRKPIPAKSLPHAAQLMVYLFGNETAEKPPAIEDSRQIGDLANCVADPEKRRRLAAGQNVSEVLHKSRPGTERLSDSLGDADDALVDAVDVLSTGEIGDNEARQIEPLAQRVKHRAGAIHKELLKTMAGD